MPAAAKQTHTMKKRTHAVTQHDWEQCLESCLCLYSPKILRQKPVLSERSHSAQRTFPLGLKVCFSQLKSQFNDLFVLLTAKNKKVRDTKSVNNQNCIFTMLTPFKKVTQRSLEDKNVSFPLKK